MSKIIAISQPTFLPWPGYLDLMASADEFILLDDVQFEKQSWQCRNRIKTAKGLEWVRVPVDYKGHFGQKIHEVTIRQAFADSLCRTLELNYHRAPFYGEYSPQLREILQSAAPGTMLADLNVRIIAWLCRIAGIATPTHRSSEYGIQAARVARLVKLCSAVNATEYLSAIGSREYLIPELHLFSEAGIAVRFQHYDPPPYRQLFRPFVPYASTLDMVFNLGPETGAAIRSGRRAPYTPAEAAACVISEE